jgi:2-succinyl-5-enolpyruvyl-6-hydroxy-3-cyclohexene-1-carboxylate synthase
MAEATPIVYKLWENAVQLLYKKGIRHVILCPGSRSAVVALSFLRNGNFNCHIIVDERSAAYTALGIAQHSRQCVALVCTSGTAALNFAPAVAEAYFQEVPLLVITTDRPAEWVGQSDNQAIHQQGLYGKNVLKDFILPADPVHPDEQWYVFRIMNGAVNFSTGKKKGPVHINAPFREPLYLNEDASSVKVENWREFGVANSAAILTKEEITKLVDIFCTSKVLVIAGLNYPNEELNNSLSSITEHENAVFLPDVTSNLLNVKHAVLESELVWQTYKNNPQELLPDLLITFGGPAVSKQAKSILRKNKPKHHWHIHPAGEAPDTYQFLTKIIASEPDDFFRQLAEEIKDVRIDFKEKWNEKAGEVNEKVEEVITEDLNDISVVKLATRSLPENSILHLGNSLPVRLANLVSLQDLKERSVTVFSNRGTSGIDGSLSSAVGNAISSGKIVTALLGDISFFYDSNALWNCKDLGKLRIIIINNSGGGIFRNIPGPSSQPELEKYFASSHQLSAGYIAEHFGCRYEYADKFDDAEKQLSYLFQKSDSPVILEIFTPGAEGKNMLQEFFKILQ